MLLILVVAAATLWPARLGGASSFIVVRGGSMEPIYHSGDLLYVRTPSRYDEGEIAVYKTPDGEPGSGILVVHRITGRTADGGFVLRGDNRSAPDDVRPSLGDLRGVPLLNLGPLLTRTLFILPLLFALVIGVAVARLLWPAREPAAAPHAAVPPDPVPPDTVPPDLLEHPAPGRQPIIMPVALDAGLAEWWANLAEVSVEDQLALPQRRPATRFSHRTPILADDHEYDERDAIDLR